MIDMNLLIAYAFGLLLIYVLARVLFLPVKVLVLLVYNGLIGGLIVFLVNIAGAVLGFHIGLNPATALLVGFMGAPGLVMLLIIHFFI